MIGDLEIVGLFSATTIGDLGIIVTLTLCDYNWQLGNR